MDTTFISELTLSMLIFAPGLFLLAISMVVGLLMLLEKGGVLAAMSNKQGTGTSKAALAGTGANPPAGEIVSDLHRTLEPAAEKEGKRSTRAS